MIRRIDWKRLLNCVLRDNPKVQMALHEGTYKGRGDYGDQWSVCGWCGVVCHRDMHMFGDGIWRHFKEEGHE
jgi:hypothetical protein